MIIGCENVEVHFSKNLKELNSKVGLQKCVQSFNKHKNFKNSPHLEYHLKIHSNKFRNNHWQIWILNFM
jgi:ribosomal protein S15P/S13E